MSLHITDHRITSDEVEATAFAFDDGIWTVIGYPGRRFGRNQAISAMTLAEELARPEPNQTLIESLRSELGE